MVEGNAKIAANLRRHGTTAEMAKSPLSTRDLRATELGLPVKKLLAGSDSVRRINSLTGCLICPVVGNRFMARHAHNHAHPSVFKIHEVNGIGSLISPHLVDFNF